MKYFGRLDATGEKDTFSKEKEGVKEKRERKRDGQQASCYKAAR